MRKWRRRIAGNGGGKMECLAGSWRKEDAKKAGKKQKKEVAKFEVEGRREKGWGGERGRWDERRIGRDGGGEGRCKWPMLFGREGGFYINL